MNPKRLVPIFLLLAVFFLLALWAGSTYNQTRLSKIPKGSAHVIELVADKADPNTLIIKTGEIVQINVKDGKVHNIGQGSADAGLHELSRKTEHDKDVTGIQSNEFGPDDGWRVQFSESGTYHFHDHLNPKIVIEVLVYDP